MKVEYPEFLEPFPIQLIKVELININACKKIDVDSLQNKKYGIMVDVDNYSEVESDEIGYMFLLIKIHFPEENDPPFEIELKYRGKCKCKNVQDYDKDRFGQVLSRLSISFLWPYMRSAVSDIMAKMDLTPFLLPTLDTIRTVKKKEESEGNND